MNRSISQIAIVVLMLGMGVVVRVRAQTPAEQPDPEVELRQSIERAGGVDGKLLEGLDSFTRRFPDYRRADIEREILKISSRMGNKDRAILAAETIVKVNERDLETLTQLIGMLRARKSGDDLKRALVHSDELIERVETVLAAGKPGRLSAAQWTDRKERSRASVRFLRGQILADLGELDKAALDFKRSFKTIKLAAAAVALGDLAEKRQARDEAIDYYVQALAIVFSSDEDIDRKNVRTKLSQIWVARFGSEAGLGDRILKTYDQLIRDRELYLASVETPNINSGVEDPLLFKLTKLEGGTIRLGDYKGKVVVLNFWATWCGPCRIEMPLLEKTMASYKNDPNVVFLAVSTDEDRPQVKPYLDSQKFRLPVVFADFLDEHYAISSIPTTMILDKQGNISFRQSGFNSREDFVTMLSEKIEAAKK
jgi:thiol-disulfide isomerase/thioredoxin